MGKAETAQCLICGQAKSVRNGTIGEVVRPSLSEFIHKKAPQWDGKGFICLDDLGKFRRDYVKEVLQEEIGELSEDNSVTEQILGATSSGDADVNDCTLQPTIHDLPFGGVGNS